MSELKTHSSKEFQEEKRSDIEAIESKIDIGVARIVGFFVDKFDRTLGKPIWDLHRSAMSAEAEGGKVSAAPVVDAMIAWEKGLTELAESALTENHELGSVASTGWLESWKQYVNKRGIFMNSIAPAGRLILDSRDAILTGDAAAEKAKLQPISNEDSV